jgi:hypothetical protein
MRRLLGQLTYSRVVSTLALFVALGGGAYAISLGRNSVTSREIAKDAVRGGEVRNGSLSGDDLKKNSLGGRQIAESELRLPLAASSSTSVPAFACDLSSPGSTACGAVGLKTSTRGRILALAGGEIVPPSGNAGLATCSLLVDGKQVAQAGNRVGGEPRDFALSGVSGKLPAGDHQVSVSCARSSIYPASHIEGDSLTAVLLAGAK